jgi:hypothetical protein
MRVDDLRETAENLGVEVTDSDTSVILKRRVRSWIKQNAS